MGSSSPADVVVVGAGPVGLTLALGLARAGVEVVVLERQSAPDPRARASHIHSAQLHGLLGLGVNVVDGQKTLGAVVLDEGEPVSTVLTEIAGVPEPYSLSLPQPELEMQLETAARSAGAEIRRGVVVAAVRQGGPCVLETSDGPMQARWVIGCDGGDSIVRQSMGEPLGGWTADGLALMDVACEPPELAELHVSRRGLAIRMPIRDGARLVAEVDEVAELPDRLESLLGEAPGDPVWTSPFRVHARWARRWRVGNLLIAGDAAHLHSPVGGHGMNTGLLDALELAFKLGWVVKGGPETLLDNYARYRMRSARWSVLSAWIATMGLRGRSLPMRWLRRWAVRATPASWVARWAIGWDVTVPAIERASGGWCRAGMRAPTCTGDIAVLDGDSAVFGNAEAVVVRPDGFVGYRGPRAGVESAISALKNGSLG